MDEFDPTGGLLQAFVTPNFVHEDHGFAVDAKDGLYMVEGLDREVFKSAAPTAYIPKAANRLTRVGELRQSGVNLAGVTALAVVPSVNKGLVDGDGVLVDTGSSVVEYGAFGEPYGVPVEVFPGEVVPVGFAGLSGSEGLAVGASGTVFASETEADSVQVFDYDSAPTVVTGAPSGVSETGLTLRGSVNPEGEEVKECYFEYGTEAGKYSDRAECEPAAGEGVGHIGKGVAAVSVSAVVSGLAPAEVRSFRLVAVSGPGVLAAGAGLTTSRSVMSGEVVSGAGSVGATASAEVDSGGLGQLLLAGIWHDLFRMVAGFLKGLGVCLWVKETGRCLLAWVSPVWNRVRGIIFGLSRGTRLVCGRVGMWRSRRFRWAPRNCLTAVRMNW